MLKKLLLFGIRFQTAFTILAAFQISTQDPPVSSIVSQLIAIFSVCECLYSFRSFFMFGSLSSFRSCALLKHIYNVMHTNNYFLPGTFHFIGYLISAPECPDTKFQRLSVWRTTYHNRCQGLGVRSPWHLLFTLDILMSRTLSVITPLLECGIRRNYIN